MPQLTSILSDREYCPLTPIAEVETKPEVMEGTLTLTTSPESHISSDSDSTSPPSSRDSSTNPSPAGFSPPRKVSFPPSESPVTSMSRPLGNEELWPLYHFEQHARACGHCFNPYAVHKEGKSLCTDGQMQGATITRIIYSKSDGQDIYATADLGAGIMTRVELPRQYIQVRSLLRTVERIGRARRRNEKKITVDAEDEGKRREHVRARNPSPKRLEERSSRRYYRPASPVERTETRRPRSPPRPRIVTRSYHESEFATHRPSTSPSSSSSISSYKTAPISIPHRPSTSTSRPAPTPTQPPSSFPSSTPPKDRATYQPTNLPFRRRSMTDGPSNAFPARRLSGSGLTSGDVYGSPASAPFRPSPLACVDVRSPEVDRRGAGEGRRW